MQQIKKKLYAAPRVKAVGFQVEKGFTCSVDGCLHQEVKALSMENYVLDNRTENMFGDAVTGTGGSSTGN